ncbi:MAG TPA: SDR family oxidoreductase [Polyangia bacterium]|nr:SDR family oxidoreductase [Polyangia bacterium]
MQSETTIALGSEQPVALVTGGAVRVGRAITEALAAAGYAVLVHHNASVAAAAALAGELRSMGRVAVCLRADLTRPGAAGRLLQEALAVAGRLDLLVNNAALLVADDGELIDLARMKALNYDAASALIDAAVPHLLGTRGSIVNVADVAGIRAYGGHKAYSRTKTALLALTFRKALELAPGGVRCNAVCPGTVLPAEHLDARQRELIVEGVPIGRFGDPADVAQAVLFLAAAPYVTGQALAVDGGQLLTMLEDEAEADDGGPARGGWLN